jgi:MFS family permease
MIAIGMIAWAVRFLVIWLWRCGRKSLDVFAGIILHGVCFDFFFVTGQIYTDSKRYKNSKLSTGLITMATYGVGMWIGTLLSGYVKDYYTVDKIVTWKSVWLVPAGIAVACTSFLFSFI